MTDEPTAIDQGEELPAPVVRALHAARTAAEAVDAAEERLATIRDAYYERVAEAIAVARSEGVKGAQSAVGRSLNISRQRAAELAARAVERETTNA